MPERKPVAIRFLSQADEVEAGAVDVADCVEAMESAFELFDRGRVLMGDPGQHMHGHVTTFPGALADAAGLGGGPDRRFSAMPAYVGGDVHKAGVKWYGSNVENPAKRGIPRSLHTITLNDPESGAPLAVMDGQVISAMRTGAVAAAGADAIQGERAEVATVVGPGVIGQTSALALDAALDSLEEIRVYHPERRKAVAFRDEMNADLDAAVVPTSDVETAVADTDVTVVAATADPPVRIDGSWLPDDTLVIPLGDLRTDFDAFDADRVFCDVRENTLEFADGLGWNVYDDVLAAVEGDEREIERSDLRTLHELVAGTDTAPTTGRSVFYSPGLPMEDVAWASRVYERARERELGETLTLFEEPYFTKPY
ncbi:ornithine cyclodeaminase [Halorubrum kocurii]|uniref:Ornithine cyclodeaminase n=1 Tax=Halorubrum kocurii JCM 14978 TaxID=1230456 RepID=M0P4S9_9EURY|nr:ornithine cyclodeaminase [Halorubrum kocurii]EMA64828.1 ornithine cyclodeaminase [Halorubrum kocurii JCM 14978]